MSYLARQNVPGSQLTTLQVGGSCHTVVDAASEADLVATLRDYPDAICIGGGSNLLIADEGYDRTLIRTSASSSGIRISESNVDVEAPVSWDDLVVACVAAGLQGLEATSGVPGSVGGAIVQNAGAYGQEIGDVVVTVRAWDHTKAALVVLDRDDVQLAYRSSRFKHDTSRRFVITGATLALHPSTTALPRYGDVSALLAADTGHDGPYELQEIRNAVLTVRTAKGMVLGASDPSAGSFFTNPIIDASQATQLEAEGLRPIRRADGVTLVSAAALIEAAGFAKGDRFGQAGLSGKHVLAIVNLGGATTNEVVALAQRVRTGVHDRFGIWLHPEPVLLGFDQSPFED